MAMPLILFDLGDTIMVEESEEKDEESVTQRADLIPGMADVLHHLAASSVLLGLVADTRIGTYRNVLRQHDLYRLFAHFSISDEVGIAKPHPGMFRAALQQTGTAPEDAIMVGNTYRCDIEGAHACGIATVWFRWNTRYPAPDSPTAATFVAANA